MRHDTKDKNIGKAVECIENKKLTYSLKDGLPWLRTVEVERRVRFEGFRFGNLLGDDLTNPMALLDIVPDDTDG